ncbi:MAG: SRPBCC domain-containing protein [Fimbriimonadaceae bacterium]
MQVINKPDYEINDANCKEATGKTISEWFAELDSFGALEKGRRNSLVHMADALNTQQFWWATTVYVLYEAHKGVVKKDGLGEGYSICVTKTIKAPVEKVYALWTDPTAFADMFGDGGKQDASEGGGISCGGGCKGTFTRVRPNKDLRFTWEHPGCTAPMTVDVMFQDNKGKTLMNVMTSRIQTRAEADGLRDAWSGFLNKLKALSEA